MNFLQLHILIAEDDVDDGELFVTSFEAHPCFSKVTWVKNGEELLDHLKNAKVLPDVILTDINMPKVNGLEAMEKIFNDSRLAAIPVFAYSSAVNPVYQNKCKELGSIAFFIKPFNLSDYNDIPYQILYMLKNRFPGK